MIEKKLTEITSRLDQVFNTAAAVQEDEIRSHLARYLCVLTSGYIEESIKIIIEYYASQNASPNIVNFIFCSTKNLTNLNAEKIEKMLCLFNTQFGEDFISILSDEEKDAIDSLVANRNNIAHGRNVGVSYVRVCNWYKNIKSILDNIRSLLSV